MIGDYPTIGCLIVLDGASFPGTLEIVRSLQQFIPFSGECCYEQGASRGRAALGGEMREMLVFTQFAQQDVSTPQDLTTAFFFLDFGEEETANLARNVNLSFERLLMPYVKAAKTLPGVQSVALGFELSPPSGLSEKSLWEAGVSILFTRDGEEKSWSRRQIGLMEGHPYPGVPA